LSAKPPERQTAPEAVASLWRTLPAIWRDMPGIVSDRVHLFALELQRARQSLAVIVATLAGAAVLLFTGWLALWFGLAAIAVDAGLALPWVVGIAVLSNFAFAGLALWRAFALLPTLAFPATMRRLTLAPVGEDSASLQDARP